MKHIISDMLAYNCWANERICSLIKDELADAEVKSSFSSIRKTLYHVWDAQYIWELRLKGQSLKEGISKSFTGSLDEAKKLFLDQSAKLKDLFQEGDEDRIIDYRNIAGQSFSSSIGEILLHVCNHSTFHRGQIVSMLRILGETELKATDLIAFYRERSSANN
jgi:uncharacterized damage-inducible protein DinB